jgi:UDP-glucose 4-epimerase
MSIFKDKTLLITGGTGSFGNAVADRFLDSDIGEIRIFSRDEKKQYDMRKKYSSNKLKFYIGDVRNKQSIHDALRGADFVFHAAALKQVPSAEFFPMEAVRTNVLGTENVLSASIEQGVSKVVCLSTDKAAYPINAMGISKAMMEKVAVAKSRDVDPEDTTISITRYGNVMASRGSVIPLFYDQIMEGQPVTVTNGEMTRFMMTLGEAVDLVMYAFEHAEQGDLFIKKAPGATIDCLAESMVELFGDADTEIKTIGDRHGEKLYESLMTTEEAAKAIEMDDFFRVPADNRDLNYDKYFVEGNEDKQYFAEYTSHNTYRMDQDEMIKKLKETKFIQAVLKGEVYAH